MRRAGTAPGFDETHINFSVARRIAGELGLAALTLIRLTDHHRAGQVGIKAVEDAAEVEADHIPCPDLQPGVVGVHKGSPVGSGGYKEVGQSVSASTQLYGVLSVETEQLTYVVSVAEVPNILEFAGLSADICCYVAP